MADTTYRTIAVITGGNRRRFYARFAEMVLAIRDSTLNLRTVAQDPDGRVRFVISDPVGAQQLARWLLELHPSP